MSKKTTIVDPIDLPKNELVGIVRAIQVAMYATEDGGWDSDKVVEVSFLLDVITMAFEMGGLIPTDKPVKAWSPRPWGRPS